VERKFPSTPGGIRKKNCGINPVGGGSGGNGGKKGK